MVKLGDFKEDKSINELQVQVKKSLKFLELVIQFAKELKARKNKPDKPSEENNIINPVNYRNTKHRHDKHN